MARQQGHHLNILSEGELEGITKPLSGNQRQSRACSNTSSLPVGSASTSANSRLHSSVAASLQLLTPEEVMEQAYDLSLEDIDSDSQAEYTSDDAGTEVTDNINTGRTSSIFGTCVADPRPGKQNYDKQENLSADEDEEYLASRQLTLFGSVTDEAESEIDSEEENDICRQIKEEIKAQMKEEMRDELALMQAHHKHQSAENEDKNADLNDLEPELRAAILKMRKLDRILLRKMKKEKEVKRDRILLQKRVRAELEDLKLSAQGGEGGGGESSDIKKNTDKFLALELPPSHNAGVKVEEQVEDMDSPPVTPLFQTQLPDDIMGAGGNMNADGAGAGSQSAGGTTSAASNRSAPSEANSAGTRTSSQRREADKRKNFIRRNRELAADAQNTIAMTDDEKQRLESLLQDIDSLPDIPENSDEGSEVSSVNPYQITLSSGEGFLPTQDEMKRLDAIDTRLRALLPPDDYESIASSPHPHSSHQVKPTNAWTYEDPNKEPSFFITQGRIPSPEPLSPDDQSVLFTRTTLHSVDVDQLGEKALKETKEHRDLQQRLKDIENELECLSSAVELELESPHLSNNQLDYLLDQCARTMSRATAETDSLASNTSRSSQSSSSRQSLYENPPHLPEEVLQQLLADARQSMGEGSSPDDYGQVQLAPHNSDGATLESVTEETLQELLDNPRTTSRQSSRASSSFQHFSPESRPDSSSSSLPREPFLPKIDPTGTMSTQKLNNDRLNNQSHSYSRPSTGRSSAVTVRNTFSDSVVNGHSSPHPPPPSSSSTGRRSGSGGKHRTVSPFTHNSLD